MARADLSTGRVDKADSRASARGARSDEALRRDGTRRTASDASRFSGANATCQAGASPALFAGHADPGRARVAQPREGYGKSEASRALPRLGKARAGGAEGGVPMDAGGIPGLDFCPGTRHFGASFSAEADRAHGNGAVSGFR